MGQAMTSGMLSSLSSEWETPQVLFDILDKEFRFRTDVCATPANAKCDRYFTRDQNGLDQEWSGTCWMNPPYGREIGRWVKKAFESAQQGGGGMCHCMPSPGPHGHQMVAGVRHAGIRDTLYLGAPQVRGRGEQRPVPVGGRDIRDPQGPGHIEDGGGE